MLFTEPLFLFLFLPAFLAVYYVSPSRLRNSILVAGSLLFYAWGEQKYVFVLLVLILLNYLIGRAMAGFPEMKPRRLVLSCGIAVNLLVLAVLKYPGFLILNSNRLLRIFHVTSLPTPAIRMPAGISFITLMGMSYLIDVYRKQITAERSFKAFLLYQTLFAYVIAGPIVRYAGILKEFGARRLSLSDFATGIRRFTIGLGKKMLIANTLALTVDSIFAIPAVELRPGVAWLAAIAYAVQLYFDISAYTDMAIGLGLMFGFHLTENFNYPYVTESMVDFWRRWHMTLVAWFRDYLFFQSVIAGDPGEFTST
jgi:alginate O-acetyltransferase complex protein AlgI